MKKRPPTRAGSTSSARKAPKRTQAKTTHGKTTHAKKAKAKTTQAKTRLRIGPNRHVRLECTLRDEEGDVIEVGDGGSVVAYVHGYGMLVPGLETALTGLAEGDQREIVVPPASGYGERDEGLVLEVDRSDLPDPERIAKGDELDAEWPDGSSQTMTVVEVRSESVVVDANHPLAGMALRYFVKVLAVRPASEGEIELAARELAEAEDEALADAEGGCGSDCGHDHNDHDHAHPHEHPHQELITLGVRKNAAN
jgi:FKBP-type peptidyl-prolyl cis-trans isomerase SlyD